MSTSNTPIQNSKQFAKRYIGLHFSPGVAEYKERGAEPYRVFLNQDTINKMDSTFEGKPVYVGHREEVSPDKIQEADGIVTRSFFNKVDGKQWVEFMAISDRAHEAIAKGWKLSNAYVVKSSASGGQWHGVEYKQEVMNGEYDHLALVPDPRYAESIILTPEEFKKYNDKKELELKKLTNSKESKSMFNLFKKSKVENSEIESMTVTLPKSGLDKSISTLINEADERAISTPETQEAHLQNSVSIGDKKLSVGELVEFYQNAMKKKNDEDEAAKAKDKEKKENDGERKQFDKDGNKKENEEEDGKDKKDKKENSGVHFDAVKHADRVAGDQGTAKPKVMNALELGNHLYGSK